MCYHLWSSGSYQLVQVHRFAGDDWCITIDNICFNQYLTDTNFFRYLYLLCSIKSIPIFETVDARAGPNTMLAFWPSDRESMLLSKQAQPHTVLQVQLSVTVAFHDSARRPFSWLRWSKSAWKSIASYDSNVSFKHSVMSGQYGVQSLIDSYMLHRVILPLKSSGLLPLGVSLM